MSDKSAKAISSWPSGQNTAIRILEDYVTYPDYVAYVKSCGINIELMIIEVKTPGNRHYEDKSVLAKLGK